MKKLIISIAMLVALSGCSEIERYQQKSDLYENCLRIAVVNNRQFALPIQYSPGTLHHWGPGEAKRKITICTLENTLLQATRRLDNKILYYKIDLELSGVIDTTKAMRKLDY